jgi:hypothetical protein
VSTFIEPTKIQCSACEGNVIHVIDPVNLRGSLVDYGGRSCLGADPDTSLCNNFLAKEILNNKLTVKRS